MNEILSYYGKSPSRLVGVVRMMEVLVVGDVFLKVRLRLTSVFKRKCALNAGLIYRAALFGYIMM